MKDYKGTNSDCRRENGLSRSPICLMLSSSCSSKRLLLSSVDEPDQKLSLNFLLLLSF